MPKRIVGAKVACLDMNLQKARMMMGVQVGCGDVGLGWAGVNAGFKGMRGKGVGRLSKARRHGGLRDWCMPRVLSVSQHEGSLVGDVMGVQVAEAQ